MATVQEHGVLILLACSELNPAAPVQGMAAASLAASMGITLGHLGRCHYSVSLGPARKNCWETAAPSIWAIKELAWPCSPCWAGLDRQCVTGFVSPGCLDSSCSCQSPTLLTSPQTIVWDKTVLGNKIFFVMRPSL